MSTALKRRLERIEAAALPPPTKKIRMLAEPMAGASDEERTRYAQELAAAKVECDLVIVVSALAPLRPYEEGGCLIVGTVVEGQLAMLDAMPSTQGNSNALDDLLKDLPGTVMGTATNPPPARRSW